METMEFVGGHNRSYGDWRFLAPHPVRAPFRQKTLWCSFRVYDSLDRTKGASELIQPDFSVIIGGILMMKEMMIADEPGASCIMAKESLCVDIQKSESKGGPTGIKEQERREESDPLKYTFKPVAMIRVQELGFYLFVMNGMNRIQESVMENTVTYVEPDVIAQDR